MTTAPTPQPTFFPNITIDVPYKMIMVRLGYHQTKTKLEPEQKAEFDKTIMDGFALCQPVGCWLRMDITEKNENRVTLKDGSELKSASLAKLLANSKAVVLMATTVGPDIVQAARKAIEDGDGTAGVIFDAVGGQSADEAMNWVNEYIRQQLSRTGEHLTKRRFSPGYGDLDLENQKIFFSLLQMEKLGLELTPRYMLVPEKSVTAIAGIEGE